MKFKAKIYLDYSDILSMCQNLEHDVSKMHPYIIVGITRGGLLPAIHLSHSLNIPMVTLQWQTRDYETHAWKGCHKEDSPLVKNALEQKKTVVFVDDINDSGKTFKEIKKHYGGGKFVSLVERCGSVFKTDARSLRLDDQRWIVFPWEKD